jgi:hypothetical protein
MLFPDSRKAAGAGLAGGLSYRPDIGMRRVPMSYNRIEMAIALSFGLTFAFVGGSEIVRDIWSALG